MKKNYLIVLFALFAFVLNVNAQENENLPDENYNMVVKMPDGTTITIGTNDVEEVSFNNGKLVISGESLNEILELINNSSAEVNVKIANIEAKLAESITKAELEAVLSNLVPKDYLDALLAALETKLTNADAAMYTALQNLIVQEIGKLRIDELRAAVTKNSTDIEWLKTLYSDMNEKFKDIYSELDEHKKEIELLKNQMGTTNPVQVNEITLSESSFTLQVNESRTITASVIPDNATNKNVTWSSSNNSIATVDQTGKVTAKAIGSCTITCSSTDGSGVKAECEVTVARLVTDITLSQTSLSLTIPGTTSKTLTATVKPTNATNKNVIWSSSDTSIATVENGKVTAIAAGTCTITCSATDGSGVKAECQVTVKGGTASIVGTWEWREGDTYIRVTLNENGTYNVTGFVDGGSFSGSGNYTYSDGYLILTGVDMGGDKIKVVSLTSTTLVLQNFPNEGNCTFYRK